MTKPQNTVDKRLTPAFKAQAGKGRKKGVPNKTTAALKDMILKALSDAGGVQYLVKQANTSPAAFMALVGKVLPMTVAGTGDEGQHKIEITWQG